jgi:DMSO reductase anchor subunit
VLAFGLFAALATASVAIDLLGPGWLPASSGLRTALLGTAVVAGSAGLACSVMVYHAVRRDFWHGRYGGVKFAATAVVLGLATATAALGVAGAGRPGVSGAASSVPMWAVALSLMAATAAKLGYEARLVRGFARSGQVPLRKTALLLRGPLRSQAALRHLLGLAGGIALPALAVAAVVAGYPGTAAAAAVVALVVSIGAEMAERYLFFTAVVRPKMPGGPLT